jgi:hypothetical protein
MGADTRRFLAIAFGALLIAAALHLAVTAGVAWLWPAAVELVLFGWVTGMILAVSYHTVPAFSAREFPYPAVGRLHGLLFAVGLALALAGRLGAGAGVTAAGLWIQAVAALVFLANVALLFARGPRASHRLPPSPVPQQAELDRLGTVATSVAGLCLPPALMLAALAASGALAPSWRLAAEHLALLGWVMGTIVGVALHVLPRFTGRPLGAPVWARRQLAAQGLGVALMVPALGLGWTGVFALGGLVMAGAIGLFGWTVRPALATRPLIRPEALPVAGGPR